LIKPDCRPRNSDADSAVLRSAAATRSLASDIRSSGTIRERLDRLLNVMAWPAPATALVCSLLLALVAFVDMEAGPGPEVQLSLFYFLPIIIASLRFEAPGGLIVALAGAVLAQLPLPKDTDKASALLMFEVSVLAEVIVFSFVALVTGALQRKGQQLQRQREALEQVHRQLQDDLLAAELLQRHLLRQPVPEVPGVEIAVDIQFARGVGGDFYNLRRVGRSLTLCVADVSGKGAKAALISATLRGLLDEISEKAMDPAVLLRHLNARLYDALPAEMFVTMFYGRLDLDSGDLHYASAGHDPPVLCRGMTIERLPPTAPALGIMRDLPGRTEMNVLQRGEILLLYTDGLTTARYPPDGRLGEERLAAWLQDRGSLPARELVSELMTLACPQTGAPPEDDVAIVALRRQ
jgi:serine phosphatase RsbU (regulator of sigma subunit)